MAAALLTLGMLAACSSGDAASSASPTPTESATPTDLPAEPVTVQSDIRAISVADDDVMTKRTGRLAMDDAAISLAGDALVALLRDDLDARNDGTGSGKLESLADRLFDADASARSMLTSLVEPGNPATTVDAVIHLGVDIIPRWAEVDMDVTRRDGTHRSLNFVLSLDTPEWQLLVIGSETSSS